MTKLTESLASLILRLGFGLPMAMHGFSKLLSFTEHATSFPDPIGLGPVLSMALAIFAELFCSLMVAAGLLTRWAAIPVVFTMAVAFLKIHATDPWSNKELSVLFGVAFLAISLLGSGRFSLDRLFFKK